MLLKDCILSSLAAGQVISTRTVAAQWGADRAAVLSILIAFRGDGLCHSRGVTPKRTKNPPFEVFTPNPATIRDSLNRRKMTA